MPSTWTIRLSPPPAGDLAVNRWRVIRGAGVQRYDAPFEQSMEEWGVTDMVRTLRSDGNDTLELPLRAVSPLSASPLPVGSEVQVFRDGARWFYGVVSGLRFGAAGGQAAQTVTVSGPDYWLRNITYQNKRKFLTSAPWLTGNTYGEVSLCAFAHVGYDWEARTALDAMEQVEAVVDYAKSLGAPIEFEAFPEDYITGPNEELKNATCADAIAAAMRWMPDVVRYWDHSQGGVPLHFVRPSALPSEPIRVGDTEDGEPGDVSGLEIAPRCDMYVPGVEVQWVMVHSAGKLHGYERTDVGGDPETEDCPHLGIDRDFAGDQESPQRFVGAVELPGWRTVYVSTYKSISPQRIPAGVAAAVFAAYGSLYWQGRVTLKAEEPSLTHWLSRRVVFEGADGAPWADCVGAVLSQTDRVMAGTTEIEFGPPMRLGPSEYVDLLAKTLSHQMLRTPGNNSGWEWPPSVPAPES